MVLWVFNGEGKSSVNVTVQMPSLRGSEVVMHSPQEKVLRKMYKSGSTKLSASLNVLREMNLRISQLVSNCVLRRLGHRSLLACYY